MVDATIIAKNFTHGRADAIRLVVLHSTENPCAPHVARNVALWFASANAPEASAHYVVGPDETVACVLENDTAWHAPPVNPYSIGIEQTGRAAFTKDDWNTPDAQAMLARSVTLVADICDRCDIPAVFVDKDGLVRGDSGITTHIMVSHAFAKSNHTDPGPNFPIDDFIARVAAAVEVLATPSQPPPA